MFFSVPAGSWIQPDFQCNGSLSATVVTASTKYVNRCRGEKQYLKWRSCYKQSCKNAIASYNARLRAVRVLQGLFSAPISCRKRWGAQKRDRNHQHSISSFFSYCSSLRFSIAKLILKLLISQVTLRVRSKFVWL